MDGNGGCCIANWTDGGHVVPGFDATKMDRIMLKFRPIAPKPASGTGAMVATSDSSNGSPRGTPHAKVAGSRGRRKNTVNKNGKKRKSSSADQTPQIYYPHHHPNHDHQSVTLLPLFPEAPDLSPTKQQQQQQANKMMPIWLDFNGNTTPMVGSNYSICHGASW